MCRKLYCPKYFIMKAIKKVIQVYKNRILITHSPYHFNAYVRGDFDLINGFKK